MFSSKDNCYYFLDYDLSDCSEGEPVDVEIFKDGFSGEHAYWTYGVIRNGNVTGNIRYLAELRGIRNEDIHEGENGIVVNLDEDRLVVEPIEPVDDGTTIGPEPYIQIRKDALNDTREELDQMLMMKDYGIIHAGNYYIAEDSCGYFYYEYLKHTMRIYKGRTSSLEGAIIPATIYDAYKDTNEYGGPMPVPATIAATAVISILKFAGIDDGMLGCSDAVQILKEEMKKSKDVAIALGKFNYVMNSDYRYLMIGYDGRSEFKKKINDRMMEIEQYDYQLYDTDVENAIYKETRLEYLDSIYKMNEDFDVSNQRLKDKMEEIETSVSEADAKTVNEELKKYNKVTVDL
ncbi:MAG: hypothetical protein PHI90_08110 [Clostridia bacterium]|nr:hypothetical protein [Clostridia bacterium]